MKTTDHDKLTPDAVSRRLEEISADATKRELLAAELERITAELDTRFADLNVAEPCEDADDLVRIAMIVADRYAAASDWDRAVETYASLRRLGQRGFTAPSVGEAMKLSGRLLRQRARWDDALTAYRVGLDVNERLGDPDGMADIENAMAITNFEKGEWDETERHYLHALELITAGNAELRAKINNNLGALYNARGDSDNAISSYLRSIPDFQGVGNRLGLAQAYHNLGMSFFAKEDMPRASEHYEKSLEISRGLDVPDLSALTRLNLAELHVHSGEIAQAEAFCKMAMATLDEVDDRLGMAEARKIMGCIEGSKRNWDEAVEFFERSVEINEECASPLGLAETYFEYARVCKEAGRAEESHRLLNKSLGIFEQLKASKEIESVRMEVVKLERLYLEVIEAMGTAVEDKDTYTMGHSSRVAYYALRVVEAMSLDQDMARAIVIAGYLHDVGKIYTPDEILNKPGKLTDEEFDEIKRHPEQGVASLKGIQFPWPVKQYILHHHERYDGGGYPAGLGGEEIPLGAQIISIADFFDAMTTTRSYRKAWSQEQTLDIITKNRGVLFSPRIVDCFMEQIDKRRIEACPTRRFHMAELWKQCKQLSAGVVDSEQCHIPL